MKSYIMVSSDVFCDNIQNTLFLSTHSSRINRYFQNHSTVNPCQGLKSTQLFSSLHRPQDSTFSFVQDVYQHWGLGWPEVHCRCNWIQFYVKFPFVFLELILKLSLKLPCLWCVNVCLHCLALLPWALIMGVTALLFWGHPLLPSGVASILQLWTVLR